MGEFTYNPKSVGAIRLHAKTMSPTTIALIMRCSVGTIELICRKHDIDMLEHDKEAPPPKNALDRAQDRKHLGTYVRPYIDQTSLVAVHIEARRRGVTPADLIAQLVERVADGRLFEAVLDQ